MSAPIRPEYLMPELNNTPNLIKIDGTPIESNYKKDCIREEFGSSIGISFITSEGIKKMEPGKTYDKNINELCQHCGYPKNSPHKLIVTCTCN